MVRIRLLALLVLAALAARPATARQITAETPVAAAIGAELAVHAPALRSLTDGTSDLTAAVLNRSADRLERISQALRDGRSVATARVRLRQVLQNLGDIRGDLDRTQREELDRMTGEMEDTLRRLERIRSADVADRDASGREWEADPDPDFWSDEGWARRRETRERWREARSRFRAHAPSFVGDMTDSWPYRETGSYRSMPAVRYNRVEGLVLGYRRPPLEWDSYDRMRVYGQGGFAFSLNRWRFEIGGEARLGRPYREPRPDVKVGVSFRRDTATDDAWKISWVENSLGAFFTRSDYMDYYEALGGTVYGMLRLSPVTQVTVAYREEEHTSLARRTTWSLFGGDRFRYNPAIMEGKMRTVLVAFDGGRIRGFRAVPAGAAFRLEAEIGSGLGGEFDFNRYTGDVHLFARTGRAAGLAVRLRAGTSNGQLPPQKTFTLGGIGSIRAYPQNGFRGRRMLLANFEYTLYGQDLFDDLLRDLSIFGLFDAGWTSGPSDRAFATDDIVPAAGVGVGFGDRAVRLELAFPLKDVGTGMEPTLWLRLSPTL